MSTPIPGRFEKLYSLTSRGEKKAEAVVDALKRKEPSRAPL